jgi:hypothetical protein
MNLERYDVTISDDFTRFEFISEGSRGRIVKLVAFTPLAENLFNLGFGDYDSASRTLDDRVVTNNGDQPKVLATVASAAVAFLHHHPAAVLYAEGSTASRTRLYQMGLNRFWTEVTARLTVLGYRDERWQPFEPGKNYEAFLARLK